MKLQPIKSGACEICGKPKGGKGHGACSKELQKRHADDKRKSARRSFRSAHAADYFNKVAL